MQLIDLSRSLENTDYADPPGLGPKITYFRHDETADQLLQFFPGVTRDQLPGGEGWAVESATISTHNGTHLDAPYHYHSTMDGGKRAITIDEVPLEWCIGRGVKLDFRHLPDGHVVTAAEIEAEFARIGHDLAPGDIVLVNTAAGAKYGTAAYVASGCGIGRDATLWMTERGMRVCGTDAWSWDAPFVHTAEKVAQSGNAGLIWEGHRAGMERAYCHMEKLANLDQLPDTGFEVQCFPVKIKAASAGWTRPVAILRNQP
ncbi:cyclase family protein [Pseudooceanicola spongiae]|uniref:Cyclase family protein n=1 Tax=Pseudooceanicola spongiae TaxID=2613965 RepID=A0A7L9WJI2_9RHOB|nr:cyclase family protein [Pseudooceanicola spongiae]QOL80132.1 cyclase family protein [Pseudooceanicola spongiae]|tara:strand:- start:66 stop:842 length:777 start_codon:yes stop_codon:yes gene_type:complete